MEKHILQKMNDKNISVVALVVDSSSGGEWILFNSLGSFNFTFSRPYLTCALKVSGSGSTFLPQSMIDTEETLFQNSAMYSDTYREKNHGWHSKKEARKIDRGLHGKRVINFHARTWRQYA